MKSSSDLSSSSLRNMYTAALKFIKEDCKKILEIASKVFEGSHYSLLVDVFWVEIMMGVSKNMYSVFNPGLPDQFHDVTIFSDFAQYSFYNNHRS
jgi:hypothetical protein